MTKKTRIVRFAVLCLVLVHLLAMTCFLYLLKEDAQWGNKAD